VRIYVDLDSLDLIEAPGFRSPITSLRLKRGDGTQLEVRFCRGGSVVPLPEGTELKFAAKLRGDYLAEPAIETDRFSFSGLSDPAYIASPNLNKDVLNALFEPLGGQPQPAEILLMAEITWRSPGRLPTTTNTFNLIVSNDVIKDDVEFMGKFTATAYEPFADTPLFRTIIRTSRVSQEDADERARLAAIALANHVAQGGEDPESYAYEVKNTEERLMEVLLRPGQSLAQRIQEEIGRITENKYGAEVLNVRRVMFVDVDTVLEQTDKSTAGVVPEAEANQLLDEFCNENSAFGFRVYKTWGGLRYVCTSGLFDPTSQLVKDILTRLRADQSYKALCRTQKCFRARLTPKPWRMGMALRIPLGLRYLNARHPDYAQWRAEYLTKIPNFATCHYQRSVGNPTAHPDALLVVNLHDTVTGASSSKPLA
jgi:hypothetical protein